MALDNTYRNGIHCILLPVFLVLGLLSFFGCAGEPGGNEDPPIIERQESLVSENGSIPEYDGKQGAVSTASQKEELPPLIDESTLVESLPWLIDTLELRKHNFRNFQITDYIISPDRRYAVVNISNGRPDEVAGPFYRFVVFNPASKKIYYPPKDVLLRDDLGHPYLAARFSGNRLAIAYGYRYIAAAIVSLPEGIVLEKHELQAYEIEEIEHELMVLLEKWL